MPSDKREVGKRISDQQGHAGHTIYAVLVRVPSASTLPSVD